MNIFYYLIQRLSVWKANTHAGAEWTTNAFKLNSWLQQKGFYLGILGKSMTWRIEKKIDSACDANLPLIVADSALTFHSKCVSSVTLTWHPPIICLLFFFKLQASVSWPHPPLPRLNRCLFGGGPSMWAPLFGSTGMCSQPSPGLAIGRAGMSRRREQPGLTSNKRAGGLPAGGGRGKEEGGRMMSWRGEPT